MNLVDYLCHFSDRYKVPSQITLAICTAVSNTTMDLVTAVPQNVWLQGPLRPFRRLTEEEAASFTPPSDFCTTFKDPCSEWVGQRCAWGPMQVWGSRLRHAGYKEPFSRLCADPELAARWGCQHLSSLADKYWTTHGWIGVIAAYSLGRPRLTEKGEYVNQAFVDAVLEAGAASHTG